MFRSNAGWVVTFMADFKTIRDRPKMKFPRESITSNIGAFGATAEHSVSVTFRADPKPTGIALFYASPKSIGNGSSGCKQRTGMRAVWPHLTAEFNGERLIAIFT